MIELGFELTARTSENPTVEPFQVPSVRRNLPNQSGLVANQKELKPRDNPPPTSSQPPKDTGSEYKDKGKKHIYDLPEDDEFSDDSGKVDIPDFIDDQSGEDCGDLFEDVHKPFTPKGAEYAAGCSNVFGGVCELVNNQLEQSEVELMDSPHMESSMAIVPYRANEFVEMLVASDYQDPLPVVNCAEMMVQQVGVQGNDHEARNAPAMSDPELIRVPPDEIPHVICPTVVVDSSGVQCVKGGDKELDGENKIIISAS
ncbi:hypothetical protein GUJ93_ZPchr0013g36873 [Zizania palustris]|uniref:Uncharacterized protein n=1 Tax=Zizania palustris TaxID=103762 RepID=A0A8J6C300_ZIZPA|nr:hypothetical protein GUJ93_ZPchr0013g36873 [Zizania palustris]